MIAHVALVAVVVMSVGGAWLALREPRIWRRTASLAAAVASITSAGSFWRLLHAYNSQPLSLCSGYSQPAGGPWSVGSASSAASLERDHRCGVGSKQGAHTPDTPRRSMFCLTLLALNDWD